MKFQQYDTLMGELPDLFCEMKKRCLLTSCPNAVVHHHEICLCQGPAYFRRQAHAAFL